MILDKLTPRKSLNKAYLKVKPNRSDIETFKENLIHLVDQTNDTESEEYHKNLVSDFLKKTYYDPNHSINTKGRNDLVIHNGKDAKSTVGVIIEAKKPTNKNEMLTIENLNKKAFHELVLYYLRERITNKNLEIKYLIATNINEWFVFDATTFDTLFAQNKKLVQQFEDFEGGRLSDTKTDFFYKQIAEPFIDQLDQTIKFTHFDLRDYDNLLRNDKPKDDNELIVLYKLFSPEHLLKLPFANDSNSLDKKFYSELLHIIGLTETKDGGKKVIQRNKTGQRNTGSLLENAVIQLDTLDKIRRLENPDQFGDTMEERLFNVGLELSITWVNRILFLKLLEAQLVAYHRGDESYSFLNFKKINNYDDLNSLFFQVLAKKHSERDEDVIEEYAKVPYLNSSLFEPNELEHNTILISNLRDEKKLPILSTTVLKDENGKKRTGELNALEYFFAFLEAYDFSSEGKEEIQEDNKTLINASVLGLIFEKINGYKDGSFFTPGFITMYMCRETIRRSVVQKFNDTKGWACKDYQELKEDIQEDIKENDRKTVRKEANDIVNSLKICDPAVGSGHFLVSALNEMIAIKSDLKILVDRDGERVSDYDLEVVNDELVISDMDENHLFEYQQGNKKSQRLQETLFHEKQTIIENCLFGVDINPNSVKICRLRLWIELLKNAYYKNDTELETLPNIDINIKCGNSLISRFALDADIKAALKKSKWTIDSYRMAVDAYRNAQSKDKKHEMQRLINDIKKDFRIEVSKNDPKLKKLYLLNGELTNMTTQTGMFEMSKKEKAIWEKKVGKLTIEIQKLEREIEDIKSNIIYENAFEWRFEFPEVLNDDGDFVGFDTVIGNPPYIRQEDFKEWKGYLKTRYYIYHSIADLLTYFVELSYNILKPNGVFQFIISNKFTRANYGKVMRSFLLNNTSMTHFVDFSGVSVFDDATVDAAILGFEKVKNQKSCFINADVQKEELDRANFQKYITTNSQKFKQSDLNENSWAFESLEVLKIKSKVEEQGVPLKDWDISINYGVKTGLNEAFVISTETKNRLVEEDPKSAELLKPMLRGRDIERYYPNFQDLWLIAIFPSLKIDIDLYPAIKKYLSSFGKRLEQSGHKGSRKKTTNKWFETQDNIAYFEYFKTPKIIYKDIAQVLTFTIDHDSFFTNNTNYFINSKSDNLEYLVSVLNSRLMDFYFRLISTQLGTKAVRLFSQYVELIPIVEITELEQKPFNEKVTQILALKKADPAADTTALEAEIDQLVYELYGLTEEEIAIVEQSTN